MARIVVVGEDPPMRGAIVKILLRSGHEVSESVSPDEGKPVAAEPAESVDVVVADLVTRERAAPAVLSGIRARFGGARVLAIGDAPGADRLDADGTLAGGFSVAGLRDAVTRLLDGRPS